MVESCGVGVIELRLVQGFQRYLICENWKHRERSGESSFDPLVGLERWA